MSNANTKIYDKTVDRAAMIRLYEERIKGKTTLIIDGHAIRVDELIRKARLSGRGLIAFREAVDKELQKTVNHLYNNSSRSLSDLVSDQASFMYQNLDSVIGKIWRTNRIQRRVAEDIVLNKPLYANKTLWKAWTGIAYNEKVRLEGIIRKGLSEGLNEERIAKIVREGATFKITKFQAQSLVTTAITNTYVQTDHEVYKANAKALQGWQYVAVLDDRTTPLCAHRDGTIYPIDDTEHLPPAHWNCRSTTLPIVKSYDDFGKLEGISEIRKRNLDGLTPKQIAFYDGQTPLKESYDQWLRRQPESVQIRHLGNYEKLEIYRQGQIELKRFVPNGKSAGIKELRRLSDAGYAVPGDTKKFAWAKEKLDAIRIGATRPEDFDNKELLKALEEYYVLQDKELDGLLSLTNYRGTLINTKSATKNRVLHFPPSEENLKYNPITGRFDDARLYQPNLAVLDNTTRLVNESKLLTTKDKELIIGLTNRLAKSMDANKRAVVNDNLRIIFERFRKNKEPWTNFKAVVQSQIRFDIMNVSDYIETQLRKDRDILARLLQKEYIDPVLGPVQLADIHDNFIKNVIERNKWENKTAPKIARKLRNILDYKIPIIIRNRLDEQDLQEFYLKFVNRLALVDTPDRDQVAAMLGKELYNLANMRGTRRKWWELGVKILDDAKGKGIFDYDTYGVQKRRMRGRVTNNYFGPVYDTFALVLKITDPRIRRYNLLNRSIDLGLRVGIVSDRNLLKVRPGYKTYFTASNYDTRIPIISSSSFSDFPSTLIDKDMADALNWATKTKYKVNKELYDFTVKLMNFQDDKGNAALYNSLNKYREYMITRGDTYERFKLMEWLRNNDYAVNNYVYLDHRARIYERGLFSPQSGEAFRPFLDTPFERNLGVTGFLELQDQLGGYLGGLSDYLEHKFNSLSISGRQAIAAYWRKDLIELGNHLLRAKPNDVRFVLKSEIVQSIDGEEQGKLFRFAIELAKLDKYLEGNWKDLSKLNTYKTALVMEQDASSSGAQIIALTTKNKQLAELSNVIPTNYKKRLYDEIAALTFNDPKFRKINVRLGLTEKDLRKAAKAQNMVTFYGAGERTGILNIEKKLATALEKETDRLVVKASDRDKVLDAISARAARYEKYDPDLHQELMALRADVKDVLNKGLDPGSEMMDQLYFLDPKTRDIVEKLTQTYADVVTPDDFQVIAKIMSENLKEQVPILRDFTRFLGRAAVDYLTYAKPKKSQLDIFEILKLATRGGIGKETKLPSRINEMFALEDESLLAKLLKRLPIDPNSNLYSLLRGVTPPKYRRTGFKIGDFSIAGESISDGIDIFIPNKMPKTWTNVPWVNFDGKLVEQNFTQVFEERLNYKDASGKWITNILQIPQKTDPTWWEALRNKSGKINDIADASSARTGFAVNGNHSNDATLVKKFHLWGAKNKIPTSTVHDAFVTNIAELSEARKALREIYADAVENNSIKATLDEMLARGLPRKLYNQYLNEAMDIGLIPVPGRSVVGGRKLTEADILKRSDILSKTLDDFISDYHWYGIGI